MYAPVDQWRRDLPCLVAVGAYSFAPVVLIHSTQVLREDLFIFVAAVACVALLPLLRGLVCARRAFPPSRSAVIALTAVILAVLAITELRPYYAVILWLVLAGSLAVVPFFRRHRSLLAYAIGGVALIAVVGFLAIRPTIAAYSSASSSDKSVWRIVDFAVRLPVIARYGFLRSGGDTNILVPVAADSHMSISGPLITIEAANPKTRLQHLELIAVGLGIVFVPVSLLRAASLVTFAGGGTAAALVAIADVDTIFQDIVAAALLSLAWRRRHLIQDRLPFVVFTVMLSAAVALLLGYVVTNYGTLFRLRTLFAVPLWTMAIGLSEHNPASQTQQ
jgi:hypothetical protein